MQLDTAFVRAQFPAFSEPALRGAAFFENAGGSYACRYTIWRLTRFYKERKVQPYAPYMASHLGGLEMDEARERLARALGIATDEVAFGPSTSANVYTLARAFAEWLKPGDAIVVTDQDHEANSGAWRRIAGEGTGIALREWRMDPETGHLDPADLADLLGDGKVRLVAFPHASNVVGEINDVARICTMARRAGAATCVDGVSYAPHGLPNVRKLGADIYLFSGYKTYGPHQGIMAIRRDLAMALPNQGHHFNGDVPWQRLTPAGPDHAQVAACAGIADYLDAFYKHHFKAGRDGTGRAERVHGLMREAEMALMAPMLDYLAGRDDVRMLGPRHPRDRVPTIALGLDRPGAEVAAALARRGIMCGGGDFYAVRPLAALGIDAERGVLRLSFVHYTTPEEIEMAIQALDAEL
ncbi:MAG: aminotransferase class V-fold PLP-dependent enzyme [Shimia sp.]